MASPFMMSVLRPMRPMSMRPASTRLSLTRTLGITTGLGFAASQSMLHSRPSLLRCDASPFSTTASQEFKQYQSNAQTPIVKGGRLNAKAVRQISAGSIFGLAGGLAVSMFSKSLAVLIGLLVFGVQTLESRGINIVPYGRLQKIFHNTNVRSAIQDNVAFKLCFGATFALAAFAEL